ncbi:MAG: HAMP domain-containing histidine kinase [Melioribacteraceae bacterium]|nr:HAMP domain-containing histidine kinase [Melioribacteraceae bacterium]
MLLIPKYVQIYEEYFKTIKRYNAWFVELRFAAILALIALLILLNILPDVLLSFFQNISVIIIIIFITSYNYYFQKLIRLKKKDEQVILSLYQIIVDLFSLSILIYVLGGIEAPIFLFYIFHMIIGSLILPAGMMYVLAAICLLIFVTFSSLELMGTIPHQNIIGLFNFEFYNNLNYLLVFLSIFASLVFISIFITSKIVKDLYEREQQLKRALDDLHQAEKSKQKYVAAVVHELKSPISAASSILDLILGDYLGEVSQLVKDKISRAKERINESIQMINNMVRFSRFRLLNKIEIEHVNLSEMIRKYILSINPLAEKKNITINFNQKQKDDVHLNCDRNLFELVFSNLFNNGIKYNNPNGELLIELSTKDDLLTIEISDTGIGIPKSDKEKIFEEYYRASNVMQVEGTGTGLNIVKSIIENHDGSIIFYSPSKISSAIGVGTTFIIELKQNILL